MVDVSKSVSLNSQTHHALLGATNAPNGIKTAHDNGSRVKCSACIAYHGLIRCGFARAPTRYTGHMNKPAPHSAIQSAPDQTPTHADEWANKAKRVLRVEAAGLQELHDRIDAQFAAACQLMLHGLGRVVTIGMGKSGHVARKIAATLASTGTPAFFVHPAEASHGDLGMITDADVVLALSNSGESDELLTIMPLLKRQGNPLIAMTGKPHSTLAKHADVHLNVGVRKEACPLGLAPTSSTTAAMAMGDALAVALLEARGFTDQDFARSHPAGSLGRQLLLRIADVMHSGDTIPSVRDTASVSEALVEMSTKRLGMTAVVDDEGRLAGVFTDGDLRRTLDQNSADPRTLPVIQAMTPNPKTIAAHRLAVEAARLMETHGIHSLLVVDADNRLQGALNIHDLLRARVV